MPLGDHLGTDQDVDLAAGEALQEALRRAAAARRIAIEPRHRGGRKEIGHLALDALRPDPDALEERPGAVRTGGRAARRVAAVVAADAAGLAVQRQ